MGRLFKEKMGMTFHQYCLLLRLQKAEELLLRTPDKIIDIALECGFNNDNIRKANLEFATRGFGCYNHTCSSKLKFLLLVTQYSFGMQLRTLFYKTLRGKAKSFVCNNKIRRIKKENHFWCTSRDSNPGPTD